MGRAVVLHKQVIAVAVLAMPWASETRASSDQARPLADAQHATVARTFASGEMAGYDSLEVLPPGRGNNDRPVQVVQAATGDAGQPREREHHWSETLSCELTIARRDIELLQRLEQERKRFARLEQDLVAARRDLEEQTALAEKTSEEASRLKQAGKSGAADVQVSLQQERERSARLEQDLAAARRDVEAQTAMASNAADEILQRKQAAEADASELRQSIQKERERGDALANDLSMTRSAMYASEAQARRAGDEATKLREEIATIANGAPSVCKSMQGEHIRSEWLEQDLAAARADAETQVALAVKAGEEASRLKLARDSSEAELQKSVQRERERSARLEQDLAAARADAKTQTALAAKIADEVLRLKRAAQSEVAELKQSMQKEREKADVLAQDLSLARSAVYAYEAQARKTGDQAAELRQAAANGAQPLRNSTRDGRDRSTQLEQDLVTARRDLDTQAALAAKASEEAARARQAAERDSASLRSSLQQERARADQLERDLALAKQVAPNAVTVGSIAQEKPAENARSVADRLPSPVAGVRSDAEPDSRKDTVAVALLARASALLRQGDIGAARIVLERAVEMGSVQASFTLAETYDPLILARWGALGTRGDAARAKDLYAKADAAGIKEAKARIEALRR
jgi:hypothetical protein